MTNANTLTVTKKVGFGREHRARRNKLPEQTPTRPPGTGRVPRIARLMALAVRFQQLIDDGVVENQAEIARLSHVSRARVTQIMNLLHLAPDIQEAILNLPPTVSGKDRVQERQLKPIMKIVGWDEQRACWSSLPTNCQIDSQ